MFLNKMGSRGMLLGWRYCFGRAQRFHYRRQDNGLFLLVVKNLVQGSRRTTVELMVREDA